MLEQRRRRWDSTGPAFGRRRVCWAAFNPANTKHFSMYRCMQVGSISTCTCLYFSTFFPITWLYFVFELEKCTLAQIHYHKVGTGALQVQQIFLYLTLLFTENRFDYCKKNSQL